MVLVLLPVLLALLAGQLGLELLVVLPQSVVDLLDLCQMGAQLFSVVLGQLVAEGEVLHLHKNAPPIQILIIDFTFLIIMELVQIANNS